MLLKDKIAVVTGGTRGIGRAICKLYAENGADIAFIYAGRDELAQELVNELEALGRKAKGYKCDISNAEAVTETFKEIITDFSTIDILVNNAGITRDKLVLAMRERDFDDVLDVNLRGAFYTTKQVYSIMAKKRSGRIINISSVAGLMGNAGQTNYAASKAGLIGLTKSVARELAGRGVTCNAIAPGFIKTDMTDGITSTLTDQIPVKRFGEPEEVAQLALYLASEHASYITGEVIRVDGGLAM